MAADISSTDLLPPAKRRNKPSSTTVASLGEDLLLEVFLRLPSLATLVRAACACRSWRHAIASSPAFRRRFRQLHPAPLLGIFFETPSVVQDPTLPAFPSFVPIRRRDRDMIAALRRGDFFLTSLQDYPDKAHSWDIVDSRGGYALLVNGDQETLAVINPLARRSERFFDFGDEDILEGYRGFPVCHSARLICSAADPTSFRVVMIAHDESRVRATFFSSHTGEWSFFPWFDLPPKAPGGKFWLHNSNMQANVCLYWVYSDRRHMVKLDTATWQFSVVEIPRFLRSPRRCCSFVVGETDGGAPCIVYAHNFKIGFLLHGTDTDGVEKWVTDRVVYLEEELGQILGKLIDEFDELVVLAVRDGFVYLATRKNFIDAHAAGWFFSLCLKTMKLEKLFERTRDTDVHPYVMAWPSSLLGGRGRFAPQDVTENA